ncbi:Fasciclin-like arabinogalactan protein 17 [Striga hermonthica]|uniref:Fasciclin-like arabinogalactan protein 17 n=1 Tax=Striga hermonthica TaxID=68872 RepID=A0A9N7MZ70_STRHE|nr:Fasciclin-like arabinogalactan protein 17 [Striga hermonthica]
MAILQISALLFLLIPLAAAALTEKSPATRTPNSGGPLVNSNSVLVALLDSHYTELSELVEKALLLQTLEDAVSRHNITILAPKNEALDRNLDPDFKRFLMEPRNLKSLQNLLLFHMIPTRIESGLWRAEPAHHPTLCRDAAGERVPLQISKSGELSAGSARVVRSDDVLRPDGVIHGVDRLLVPKSVQQAFNGRRSLRAVAAVLPSSAPEVDPRTHRLRQPAPPAPAGSPPALPIYDAMAPGPSLAPAPAPGPGGPRGHFDGESQVRDFIATLLRYGGYGEVADMLANLTSVAAEMGRLVSEGYVVTVLAPNDEAMAKVAAEEVAEAGAAERLIYYHMIPEYQTEESMYNAVRRFGKVRYDTLRLPHKVVAEEADGSVRFGSGDAGGSSSAYLFDADIYTDGRISVQGIDGVLRPPEETKPAAAARSADGGRVVSKPRRGKLLEIACNMLGAVGQDSHFSSCH